MAKCGVVGDRDSVMLFKAVGMDVFFETDGEQATRRVKRMAKDGYAVIYVTETLYPLIGEAIEEYKQEAYPAIIPLPDAHGSKGVGMQALKSNVEKAVGVDILANN